MAAAKGDTPSSLAAQTRGLVARTASARFYPKPSTRAARTLAAATVSRPPPRPRFTSSRLAFALRVLCLCSLALGLACPSTPLTWPEDAGFDDHSFAEVTSEADFRAHARASATGSAALKFVIVGFTRDRGEHLRFLDGNFYAYHDEWYWFRLINGHEVPGARVRPLAGHSFEDIDATIAWARAQAQPILDLRSIDERLYSDRFYELAVRHDPRRFGLGTLVSFPAHEDPALERSRPQLWGFELEYGDALDAAELAHFFALLRASLPAEIAAQLRFIARSPAQVSLVEQLRAAKDPLAEVLSTYAELAIPGEIEVYNPGLIAGRLRKLPSDPDQAAAALTAGDANAIWLMPSVPDELPAAAGLITAVPQTPLAHVNLLARNRGIPNLYLGGAMQDPQLDSLARIHAPVVLLAEADGTLRLEPIHARDYARWRALRRPSATAIAPIDLDALPYTLDLDTARLDQIPALRRSVGGKAAGFVALVAAGVTMPERPLAISVRAYAEHIHELRPLLEDLLADPGFRHDPRVRYLLLEGRADFDQRFSSPADQAWAETFLAAHPPRQAERDAIASLLSRGGVKRAIRERPLAPAFTATLDAALAEHFADFAPEQGLRFRSSSSVEDVEGFSGAGLYDSNTGFLHPELQAEPKQRTKSVAWALRKTWASYWRWEAFEERRLTGLDHLAGNMAVLVHARFDDELEEANGVLTLTLDRSSERTGGQRSLAPELDMEVDVQGGALSVTNPPPELAGKVLPEVDRLGRERSNAAVVIERVAASTESPDAPILDDATLTQLLLDSAAIAARWLEVENLALSPAQARARVTLDIEFRVMAAGWPARSSGHAASPRLVIKQARSLDPGVPAGARALMDQPIPRELLLYVARVERRSCRGAKAQLDLIELWTNPMHPVLGHADEPFLARLRLDAPRLPDGGLLFDLDHLALRGVEHPGAAVGAPWAVRVGLEPAVGIEQLEHRGGLLRLTAQGKVLLEEPAACRMEVVFDSPDAFLRGLLP